MKRFFVFIKNQPKNLFSAIKERHRSFLGWLPPLFLGAAVFLLADAFSFEEVLDKSFILQNRISGGPETRSIAFAFDYFDYSDISSRVSAIDLRNGAVAGWAMPISSPIKFSPESEPRGNIMAYVVQPGDTLESLAMRFSLDEETILWANHLSDKTIFPGESLIILPVSGVLHEVSQGESLKSIADYYKVPIERIVLANSLERSETVMPGEKLVIPGAKAKKNLNLNKTTSFSQGFLRMPTTGWNWGRLHANNAVDIANSCGVSVFAAAAGFISEVEDGGWNNGYGSFIKIKHKNNIETLYAHLSAVFVSPGAFVNQGDLIGAIGRTGKVDGATGCHLHFEVHGSENPFVR